MLVFRVIEPPVLCQCSKEKLLTEVADFKIGYCSGSVGLIGSTRMEFWDKRVVKTLKQQGYEEHRV